MNLTNPFVDRGGNYNNTTNAGVFYSGRNNGNANDNHGFRACLVHFDTQRRYKASIPEGRLFTDDAECRSV